MGRFTFKIFIYVFFNRFINIFFSFNFVEIALNLFSQFIFLSDVA